MKINGSAIIIGLLAIAGLTNCQTGAPVTGPSGTVCESAGGSCEGNETGMLISYANNCTKYIACLWGCGCDMECPDNLHFNSKLQVCDWPENAGCDPSYVTAGPGESPSPGEIPGPGETPGPGEGPGENPDPSPGPSEGPGPSPGPSPGPGGPATGPSGTVCESPGGSCVGFPNGHLISYSGNCSKYIVCNWDCGCDMDCPPGLHFNSNLQVCDWPENAGCDSSYVTPGPGPGETPSPGPGPGATSGPGPGEGSGPGPGVTPNPGPGEGAGPGPGATPGPGPGEGPDPGPGVTPSPGPGVTPSQGPGVTPSPGPGVTPSPGPGEGPGPGPGVTPSPGPGEGPGPGPGATPGPGPGEGPGPTPGPGENPGPSPSPGGPATGPSGTVCESPGGTCVGVPNGTRISYSGNSSKYIVCQWDCGCDMDCPPDLHFNSNLQVCDWPENAGYDAST